MECRGENVTPTGLLVTCSLWIAHQPIHAAQLVLFAVEFVLLAVVLFARLSLPVLSEPQWLSSCHERP